MSSDESHFLEIAAGLGKTIADSAIWFDGRCNWVGALPREEPGGSPELTALGPDLYGGTGGVALFLAEAGASLDDNHLRATARGAIRHALDHADRIQPDVRDGLYLGSIGVAYAAVRVAGLLDDEVVMARASELLGAWRRDTTRSASPDVMSGCAGAAAGLVALTEQVEEPWLVDAAVCLGEELIHRAETTPAGCSWPVAGRPSMHHLCGLSHGGAGIGHALAEIFGLTGEPRFRDAAERAFDHERAWFDSCTGTWPDLRDVPRVAAHDAPMPTADSWCNGAPGIALSRLRAAELLGTAAIRDDAGLALAACERHVAEVLLHAPADFSLCHGAGGVGDVLLHAAKGPADRHARLAADIGRSGTECHDGPGAAGFRCGVPRGETPGLLLGLAGIGMFYLRLVDRGVASPLLVHRGRA